MMRWAIVFLVSCVLRRSAEAWCSSAPAAGLLRREARIREACTPSLVTIASGIFIAVIMHDYYLKYSDRYNIHINIKRSLYFRPYMCVTCLEIAARVQVRSQQSRVPWITPYLRVHDNLYPHKPQAAGCRIRHSRRRVGGAHHVGAFCSVIVSHLWKIDRDGVVSIDVLVCVGRPIRCESTTSKG